MKLESTVMPKPSPLLDNTRSFSPYILPLHTCNRLSQPVARTTTEQTSKIQERRLARSQHSVYNVRKALPRPLNRLQPGICVILQRDGLGTHAPMHVYTYI